MLFQLFEGQNLNMSSSDGMCRYHIGKQKYMFYRALNFEYEILSTFHLDWKKMKIEADDCKIISFSRIYTIKS